MTTIHKLLMAAAGVAAYDRGVWMGPSLPNVIDYITISTTGDATDFGDWTDYQANQGGNSNGQNDRAVGYHDMYTYGGGAATSNYKYITMSTPGNSVDFGDDLQAAGEKACCSNMTNERGTWWAGQYGSQFNVVEYLTISSLSNGTDFGDCIKGRQRQGLSNGTNERGIAGGGKDTVPAGINVIDYITINSTGNSTAFGDLTSGDRQRHGNGISNNTSERGVFTAGYYHDEQQTNNMEYITINSAGNSTDFGDASRNCALNTPGLSNAENERGCYTIGTAPINTIEYITINSTGNGTDFGDLTVDKSGSLAASNAAP